MSDSILPEFYNLPFLKMQALGNDFVFVDGEQLLQSECRPLLSQWTAIVPHLARLLCHRQLSIGADGLILALPLRAVELRQMAVNLYGEFAQKCDFSWVFYNNDGSPAEMCGNGLRCLALWARLEKHMSKAFTMATQTGPVKIEYLDKDRITVTLNPPKIKSEEIPFQSLDSAGKEMVRHPFVLGNDKFPITCVNVGNPHCVIYEAGFLKDEFFEAFDRPVSANFYPQELAPIASAIEIDSHFPRRTNVHFARVLDRNHIQQFVWERGVGPTMASGSAASAAVVAGILEKRLDRKVNVILPGGTLLIEWLEDNGIKMTGDAHLSFRGQIKIESAQLKPDSIEKSKMVSTKVKLSKAGAL